MTMIQKENLEKILREFNDRKWGRNVIHILDI